MTSDLFDFHKLMEMENFGVKRYNKFVFKGQIDKEGHREGFGVQIHENGGHHKQDMLI